MILLLLVSTIFPLLSGSLLISLLWPTTARRTSSLWVRFWLAVGAGLGIASLNLFLCTLLTGSVNRWFILGEVGIIIALFAMRQYAHTKANSNYDGRIANEGWSGSLLRVFFFITLIIQGIVFGSLSLRSPHGDWDAWIFWNMRARFMFRAGTHWKEAFSTLIDNPHPDYPLMVPANVMRLWTYVGGETPFAPVMLAFVFTFATVGLLVSSLSALRGRTQGLVGGLILLTTPFFIRHGADQYADVPLGFFFLAAVALLSFSDETADTNQGFLALSGLMAAFAAWTKNEGLLFVIGLLTARWLVVEFWKTRRVRLRTGLLAFVAGALPVLLITLYFKTSLVPQNDLVAAQGAQTASKLSDLSRYLITAKTFLRQALQIDSIPVFVLPFYAFFLGTESAQVKRPAVAASSLVLVLMLAGYFLVFIVAPYDLELYLRTSLDRLFLQLWPTTIFLFLMVVASPRRVAEARPGGREDFRVQAADTSP